MIPSNVWDGWRSRTDKENLWKNLWNAHGLSSKITVAGKSVQNRDIYLFEAGNPSAPVLFVDAEMHGNEDHTFEFLTMFAYWLLNGEDTGDATAQRIMQNNKVLFMPIVDTDRSSKLPEFARENANLVNLNRNFVYNFRVQGQGTDAYSGPSAASEPETKAVKNVFNTYKPKVYVNLHVGLLMASAYGNSAVSNEIISNAPSFTAYYGARYGGANGGAGYAVSDAVVDSPGVSAWLVESYGPDISSPWRHDSANLNMINTYYPRIKEFLISALQSIEA